MTNENRSVVRLIPLWIILIGCLVLTLWSVKQLAVSIVKTVAPSSESVPGKVDAYGMGGYPGSYNNYCLIAPMYPPLSSSMMPGTTMTEDDKLSLEKYSKEMEKYNADYATACKEDLKKQEMAKEKMQKFACLGSVTVYAILALFGIFSTALALLVIRRNEAQ